VKRRTNVTPLRRGKDRRGRLFERKKKKRDGFFFSICGRNPAKTSKSDRISGGNLLACRFLSRNRALLDFLEKRGRTPIGEGAARRRGSVGKRALASTGAKTMVKVRGGVQFARLKLDLQ